MLDSEIQLQGSYFSKDRSLRQVATLIVRDTGQITLFSVDKKPLRQIECLFLDLSISPRLANTPRFIGFTDGSSFETSDNESVDNLLTNFRQGLANRFIHWLESHSLMVFLVVILLSVFVWGSIKYGVPATAKYGAKILPGEFSQYLGQGTLDILDKSVLTASELSQQRQNELTDLFKSYSADYSELDIRVKFRQGGDIGANAMALPGGQIIFTDELINLAQHDLELVSIYGHEIGHLVHRHMLRRVIQDSLLSVLLVFITADVSSTASLVFSIPGLLLELAYSRDFESEADDFAAEFLAQNNINTQHFAAILLRLRESHHNPEKMQQEVLTPDSSRPESVDLEQSLSTYLSTHPATYERIQKFQTLD